MSRTPNLNLPYLAEGQAQKHVTVNEALLLIDSLAQVSVAGPPANGPPETASEGERRLVGPEPTGAWAGQAGRLAVFTDGAWRFHAPRPGWLAHVLSTHDLLAFDGDAWRAPSYPDALQNLDQLGVGAVASPDRRLTVASAGAVLSHDGSDHRLVVNKAASGDTASIVFQSDWSGRAEVGLTGDDALRIKVSTDGSIWRQALRVEPATGAVSMPMFDSVQVTVGHNSVVAVPTPSRGGIVFVSLVDQSYPQNPTACIFAYDTGASPLLTTMVLGAGAENRGSTTLSGTTSTDGKIGFAVDAIGRIHIENRFSGGTTQQFCLTFINGWRAI